MNVVVVNESSDVSEHDAWNAAWACDHQVRFQFGRYWPISSRVTYIPKGIPFPANTAVCHLLDTSDQAGALGYHDEDGNELPFSRIFTKTSLADGSAISAVLSHEILELLVDPHVNLTVIDPTNKRLYGYEVGDPCEGYDYDVGDPEGHVTGVKVANFVWPNWFDPNTPATAQSDYRGALHGAFAVAPTGYTGWLDLNNYAGGWQSSFGSALSSTPQDDRLQRRAGTISPVAGAS